MHRVPCGAPQTGPPKTRKGRSHDDDWYQGKFSLHADVSLVRLAAGDKKTYAYPYPYPYRDPDPDPYPYPYPDP